MVHGPHRSPEKKKLNQKTHLRKAMIKLIKRKDIISFLRIEWSLFGKTSQSSVKIAVMDLEKILKFRQSDFAISFLSPLGRRRGPSIDQISPCERIYLE